MLIFFCVVSSLLLVVALSCLEAQLREHLLARRGRYTLDMLRERTGLSRRELAPQATRHEDGLYTVDPALFAHAKALRPKLIDHPLVAMAAAALLVVGLIVALRTGEPAWGWFAPGGGIVLVAIVGAVYQVLTEEADDDDEALAAIERDLERVENGNHSLTAKCVSLVALSDQLETAVREERRTLRADPTTPFAFNAITHVVMAWEAWQARRLTRQAEALVADVRSLQARLRDLDEE